MLKWPMWLRIVIGALAFFLCVILSWYLVPGWDELGLLIVLPGAALFIYLNPELMQGKWPPDP